MNQFLKISNYLKACSVRSRGAQSASLSTLNSLRGCWVSTAAAAQSSVSSEADGKCSCWSVQFSSVAQSCLTLCNPMNRSTPGLPVHHQIPEFTQTHVHRVGDTVQPSQPLLSPSPPASNPSQYQSLFQSGGKKYWSFSFSFSPSNEHSGLIFFRIDWFDLPVVQGTLKSLLQHHSLKASILRRSAFFTIQLSHDHWKNHSLD